MSTTLLTHATEQLVAAQAEADRIAGTFKVDEKGRFTIAPEQHRDYTAAVARAKEIKSLVDAATASTEHAEYLAAPAEQSVAAGDAVPSPGFEAKTLGDLFIGSDAYKRAQANGFDDASVRSLYTAFEGKSIFNLTGGSVTHQALGTAQTLPMVDRPLRKNHIRDLFPKSTTRAAVLYGVKETGWVNNAALVKQRMAANGVDPATGVAPGGDGLGSATPLSGGATDVFGRAPKSSITIKPVLYPVAEIAHLLDVHKNILSDEPRLRTFLNTRMMDGLKYEEDYQLLWGVAGAESITGIFNTPGLQQYTGLATDKSSVQIRRAITKVQLAEYDATGIVLSPTRWEELEVEETDDGAFRISTSVAVGAVKKVWTLDVVGTTAMTDDIALIGAFGMGSQIHDRESIKVSVSTEHGTNFSDGVVSLRADQRLAFEVARPESHVALTWTPYTGPVATP